MDLPFPFGGEAIKSVHVGCRLVLVHRVCPSPSLLPLNYSMVES